MSATTLATGARRVARKYGTTFLLAAASQVVSACAMLLLPFAGLVVADVYSAATFVAFGGFAGVCIGVVYPLAVGRVGFDAWRRWACIAVLAVLALAVWTAATYTSSAHLELDARITAAIMAMMAVGGAALSICGILAVRLACLGHANWLAAVPLWPNAGFLAGVLVAIAAERFAPDAASGALWPASLLCVAAVAAALRLWRASAALATPSTDDQPTRDDGPERRSAPAHDAVHAAALTIGVVTSTALPPVYLSALLVLGPGAVFWASFVQKIITSLLGTALNAMLLVKYNWVSPSHFSTAAPAVLSALGVSACLAAVLASAGDWDSGSVLGAGVVAMGLALALLYAAAVLSLRELNARANGLPVLIKVSLDLLVTVITCYLLFRNPSLSGYFAVVTASQGITVGVCGLAFRHRTLAALGLAGTLAAIAVIVVA